MDRSDILFRRSTRLKHFDYRRCVAYFVTICVADRACVFGEVVDGEMRLSRRGMIARDCWLDIPNHHPHVELDEFVIMPNHLHGIVLFVGDATGMFPVVATPASRPSLATGPAVGSLGAVIGSYKSAVTRNINRHRPGAATGMWQHNYYDHIIRNDFARDRIGDYILMNPLRWAQDEHNPTGDATDRLSAFMESLAAADSRLRRDATQASPLRCEPRAADEASHD